MALAPVSEIARRVDEHVANEGGTNVLSEALEIYQRLRDGDSTGSRLADMVIMRSGIYLPRMIEKYRQAEERIKESVGQVALVIVHREIQDRIPDTDRWSSTRGHGEALAGRITGPDPVIDFEHGRWAIQTDEYFTPHMGERNLVDEGPMPVNDLLAHPATPSLSSTLGQIFCSETTTRPSGDHIPLPIAYRVLQETELFIGDEISNADIGILAAIELVPPAA